MTLLAIRVGLEHGERHALTVVIFGLWFGISREIEGGRIRPHIAVEWPSWRYWRPEL